MDERITDHENRLKKLEEKVGSNRAKKAAPESKDIEDVVASFKLLDLSEYDYIYDLSSLPLFSAVILIAKNELDADGLTPTEISSICKEKIRIPTGADRTTISNTPSGAGAIVDRIDNPRERGYAYRIMRDGERHLQQVVNQNAFSE